MITKLNVTNATLVKVPFDLEHWTKVADELYPNGLPEPYSNDPPSGCSRAIRRSTEPLQVAVARLLGYRWPDQEPDASTSSPMLTEHRSDPSRRWRAAGRRAPARAAGARLGARPGPRRSSTELLAQAGARWQDIETWLRESFFASHAKLFHNRPFIWHIWDGRKDGFGVLVNYHRLDRQLLDKLTYTLPRQLDRGQRDQVRKRVPGAEARLVAAQRAPAQARADRRRRAPLRHLRALEAARRAADRLGPGPERRRAPEHPPVRHRRRASLQVHDQLEQGPRQESRRLASASTTCTSRRAEKQAAREKAGR